MGLYYGPCLETYALSVWIAPSIDTKWMMHTHMHEWKHFIYSSQTWYDAYMYTYIYKWKWGSPYNYMLPLLNKELWLQPLIGSEGRCISNKACAVSYRGRCVTYYSHMFLLKPIYVYHMKMCKTCPTCGKHMFWNLCKIYFTEHVTYMLLCST